MQALLQRLSRSGRWVRNGIAPGAADLHHAHEKEEVMGDTMLDHTQMMEIPRVDPAKKFSELGIMTMDGSGSMLDMAAGKVSKGEAVNQAIRSTLSRFKVSSQKESFDFAMVAFSDRATIRLQPTPATQIDDLEDYDPTHGLGGGTNIWTGLEEAEHLANDYLAREVPGGVPHKVCLVLLSDGGCSNPGQTQAVAERIKTGPNGSRITIATVFLATIGQVDTQGEQLLRSVASSPTLTANAYDCETLRKFFTRSMSMSAGIGKVV